MTDKKEYSVIFRIMHWSIAICMILLLLTIFLRMTWMNKHNVSDIIQEFLADKDLSLDENLSIKLAKKIRAPMWDWHIYLGYVLVGLFALRFLLPFIGVMKFNNPFSKGLKIQQKVEYWVFILFYLCITASLFTGMMMEFGPEEWEHDMEDIHVWSLYYLLTYIIIHIGGVVVKELTTEKGLISRVISGKNK
jgi:cytochrome b561